VFLFAIALLGTALHCSPLAGVRPWVDALPGLFYLPIVIAAINQGTKPAISVAFASGLAHAVAFAFGCGDQWVRPFTETLLYLCVAVTAAKLSQVHGTLSAARQGLSNGNDGESLVQAFHGIERGRQIPVLRQMAAGLIHRFRRPVTSIEDAVCLLEDPRFPEEKRKEFVRIIQKESHQLDRALCDIQEFAQPRKPRYQKVDLSPLVDQVIQRAGPKEHGPFFLFRKDFAPGLPFLICDPRQISNMLLDLVMNSIQATPGGGQIEVAARPEKDGIAMTISDHGRGIPPAIVARVFDPFFTTRGNGLGLGLAVARQIVAAHYGKIAVGESSHVGTSISLWLPLNPIAAHEYRPHTGG